MGNQHSSPQQKARARRARQRRQREARNEADAGLKSKSPENYYVLECRMQEQIKGLNFSDKPLIFEMPPKSMDQSIKQSETERVKVK